MNQEILGIQILMNQTVSKNIVKMINNKLLDSDYEDIYREILEYEAIANPLGYSFIRNLDLNHKDVVKTVFKERLISILDVNEGN